MPSLASRKQRTRSDEHIEFWTREPSFSLIYFSGDVLDAMPVLLASCGWAIIAHGQHQGTHAEIVDAIGPVEGPQNSIVYKAVYPVPGGTVLLDPEMVVGVSYAGALARLCAERSVEAIVAIWERYSESISCKHIGAQGVLVDVYLMQGIMGEQPVNPPPSFLDQTGPGCLKAFLASAGAPLEAIFGNVTAAIYKLDESAMLSSQPI